MSLTARLTISLESSLSSSLTSDEGLSPLLQTPDFDGDGRVDFHDVRQIFREVRSSRDRPFFDVNGDGKVSLSDAFRVVAHWGRRSSSLDQQIAAVYQATSQFAGDDGFSTAIASGFTPITPEFKGHGVHYFDRGRFAELISLGKNIDPSKPVGLNYSPQGELLAAFYLALPDNFLQSLHHFAADAADGDNKASFGEIQWGAKPDIFADDPILNYPSKEVDGWHQHRSLYIGGLDFANKDWKNVEFEQNLTPEELFSRFQLAMASDDITLFLYETQNPYEANATILPGFWMAHAWVHKTNPNGLFATTNPLVSVNAPDEHGGHGGGHGGSHHS